MEDVTNNLDGTDTNVGSIDKDIEIVKKIIDKNKDIVEHFKRDTFSNFPIEESENEIQALENVLSELKETKETLKCTQDSWYKDTQELETYKKIAEKLADLLLKGDESPYICDLIFDEHCNSYKAGECGNCIIDWARNEVENGK